MRFHSRIPRLRRSNIETVLRGVSFLFLICRGSVAAQQTVDSLSSATIRQLLADLPADGSQSEERFWMQIQKSHAPIVEAITDDDQERLVTGTNVWFRTYRLDSRSRFSYRLGPEAPTGTRAHLTDQQWQEKVGRLGLDRYNPDSTDGPGGAESVLALPNAPPQNWIAPRGGVVPGRLESFTVHSAILGNDRTIQVYHPAGVKKGTLPSRALVILDGEDVPARFPVTTILDNMVADRATQPTMAIMIGNAGPGRVGELWYSEKFAEALKSEFLPEVARRYGKLPCPRHCVVAGRSLGGSAAMFPGYRLPDVFSGVIAQSGGFHYAQSPAIWNAPQPADRLWERGAPESEWLTRQLALAPSRTLRVYLEVGTMEDVGYEARILPRYGAPTLLVAARHLRDVLTARGYSLRYHEFVGNHRNFNWRGTLGDAIEFVLGDERPRH